VFVTDDPQARGKSSPPAIREIAQLPPEKRSAEQSEQLAKYFQSLQPQLRRLTAQREDIERRLTEEYKPDKTPIMKELAENERRKTHMFIRGSFLSPGEEVNANTPAVFPAFSDELPRNRLGLAKWLVDRNNPLTARVAANRQWEQLFGNGIVLTSEDFGSQGMLPTHPELLDWLAVELIDNEWSLKKLTKMLVMSAAYRQSSRTTPEKLARDPDNRLISRGPRDRLTAEQIRDQALAVSGLLSDKMGGPSVMPPQPDGVWQVVYSDDRWVTSKGEDRYRRGLYTFWRRTSPYPSAMALDATSRETCTVRRISTNTPIAAFALLNDPAYVEAAQALARQIVKYDNVDVAARATYAFRRVLSRQPAAEEVQQMVALFDSERSHYQKEPDAALKMALGETGQPEQGSNVAELAAWTVVSNVLLNLDETLNN
jgi:TolA-binding protein